MPGGTENAGPAKDGAPTGGKLGWLGLAFIAYSFTAAGPFGIETAVKSCGPLITILGLIFMPLFYVTPQILIVSEMATMMPSSHGSIIWVQRAYGNCAGFVNSMTSLMHNFIDCAIYPTLFTAYVTAVFYPQATYWEEKTIGFGCVCFGTFLALMPAWIVGHAATVMSVTVMGPFIVGMFAGAKRISAAKLGNIHSIYNNGEYEFGTFLSTLIWLFTGWRSMGTMGGEVSKPTDFIKGLPFALVLGATSYMCPLLVAASMDPPAGSEPWEEGYLAIIFNEVLAGLGTAVAAAGAFGNVCLFSSSMMCYPRGLWGVAERGWAPKIFTKRHPKTHSPYVAVLMHAVVATIFLFLDFSALVRLETFIGAPCYIMSATCMARLRWTEPDTYRPIKYPKNRYLACLVVMGPTVTFTAMVLFNLQTWWVATAGIGVYVAVLIAYFIMERVRRAHSSRDLLPHLPCSEDDATGHQGRRCNDESPRSLEVLADLDAASEFDGATSPTWIPPRGFQ